MRRFISVCFGLLFLVSCQTKYSGEKAITYQNIEKHIAELSGDQYKGRKPMSDTEEITINYIAGQMQEIGLEPACNGSYFQEVPLLSVFSDMSETLNFDTPKGKLQLRKMEDYVSFTRRMDSICSLDVSELVFAGFGITAPEYGRDDFQGMDLTGKTVLVFVNDPGYGTSEAYFKGNTMTYYGRWTYKFEEAARRGARACLIVHETGPAGYPWSVVRNNGETTKLYLQDENGYQDRCALEGWITKESAEKLFADCGLTFDQAKQMALKPDFRPISLKATVSGTLRNKFSENLSHNVCGFIRGSKYPDEVVVYLAHWDHLGIGTPVRNDSIYNGATDNASAVSWMLEIARAFKHSAVPERSVLFVSVTGEESGLLGSEFYVNNPFFPMNKTVACINTDVNLFLGKYRDVTITGFGQSELDEWVREEAEKAGRYIAADPNPENGMYFRSDQFPFVKEGVPAIFCKGYVEAEKYGKKETMNLIDNYWKEVYHTPFDEYHSEMADLSGLVEDARLMFRVGCNLANTRAWPGWNAGSEFKAVRDRSLNFSR